MRSAGEDWQRFFDSFTSSAWRLELHPIYTMPEEAGGLSRWRAGERLPDGHWSSWMDRVAGYGATGRTIGRVHVVRRPLSEYIRFEFDWYYRHHVRAGEDIRILDLTSAADPGLPDHDFWLLDERQVVKMLYRPDGTQITRELVERPDVEAYIKWRDVACSAALPALEYWAGLDYGAGCGGNA
jgi:hypothetical protein